MEYGINRKSYVDYIFFILLLVSTSFEFFFRAEAAFFIMTLFAFFYCFNKKYYPSYLIYFSFIIFILCFIIQWIVIDSFKITSVISRFIFLYGSYLVACIISKRFLIIYQNVIYWITFISIIIYLSCTLSPTLKDFLINNIAPYFTSLNAASAIQEGGGINILIYNFQTKNLLDSVGFMRNCGPFWEPGMYAVFLSIALFINLFVYKCPRKYFNELMIFSLVTTFSTGGYVALSTILLFYVMTKKNILVKIISIIIFIISLSFLFNLDFVGNKIIEQINSAETGNDISRFSAILTQFEMIRDKPITGGAIIEDYVDPEDSTTLASGLFFTFIQYGIPIGILFYILYFISIKGLFKQNTNNQAKSIMFFILLLILSISQTIFANSFFISLLYVGLLNKNKNYGTF